MRRVEFDKEGMMICQERVGNSKHDRRVRNLGRFCVAGTIGIVPNINEGNEYFKVLRPYIRALHNVSCSSRVRNLRV
jgi:hypothetical protein